MVSQASETRHEFWRRLVIDLTVMVVIGLGLAVVGPFGSFAAPLALRLVYWIGLCVVGYACYRPIAGLVQRLGPLLHLPEGPLWIAGCVIATVPMTAVVWLVDHLGRPLAMPDAAQALTLFGYVLVIGGGITAISYLLEKRRSPAEELAASVSEPMAVDTSPPRFLERIAPTAPGELLALEMEDHYLRAHTVHGSHLLLMRMRDALAELDGLDGAQVHRSWWVARHAVLRVRREGRAVRLVLGEGLEAPVARNAVAGLKAAGWW